MRQPGLVLFLFGIVLAVAASAEDCIFSQIRWRDAAIEFLAGSGDETRTLVVDPATGRVTCEDPRVGEPIRAGDRVLFADRFGVFEIADGSPPRTVVFLPRESRCFLRALGADSRGRILLWTYDRERNEHALWTAAGGALERAKQANGPAALGAWQARNVARPFAAAIGRFVRSTCLRRPAGDDRLCLEMVAGTPHWRMTQGPPGNVTVHLPACTPIGFAALPDSGAALVEVLEPEAGGQALVTWLASWAGGGRRVARVAPAPASPQGSWLQVEGRSRVLWVDASGSLWRIPLDGGDATPLVAVPPVRRHADVFRVALAATRASAADSVLSRLTGAGQTAAVAVRAGSYEVQAGVFAARGPAQARAASLRQLGLSGFRAEAGDATRLAPGVDFGHTTGPGGRTAWVRLVARPSGTFAELWTQSAGGAPHRLVPTLDTIVPGAP